MTVVYPCLHSPIRVFIADAYPIMRTGLVTTIESESQMQVIGTATRRDDLLPRLRTAAVDVLVINLVGLGDTLVALLHQIKQAHPHVGVVVLAATVYFAPEVLAAGAHAYISYAEPDEQLHLAIRAAKARQHYMSPLTQEYVDCCATMSQAQRLVPRELQILKCMAEGMRAREIARNLNLSDLTIHNYISRLRKKTGWSSRTEMVHWYRTMYGNEGGRVDLLSSRI
ncbi:MAG TPA: response regulator transcription factor [Herpetosiphonaceae bacterium]|nr:response regulator transcription factor [Herpetosiphonaceae bacterium]